jgi:hypothetical protein
MLLELDIEPSIFPNMVSYGTKGSLCASQHKYFSTNPFLEDA